MWRFAWFTSREIGQDSWIGYNNNWSINCLNSFGLNRRSVNNRRRANVVALNQLLSFWNLILLIWLANWPDITSKPALYFIHWHSDSLHLNGHGQNRRGNLLRTYLKTTESSGHTWKLLFRIPNKFLLGILKRGGASPPCPIATPGMLVCTCLTGYECTCSGIDLYGLC